MVLEATRRPTIAPDLLGVVRERTRMVLHDIPHPAILPRDFANWETMNAAHLNELTTYLHEIKSRTASIKGDLRESKLQELNANGGFQDHLEIMATYMDVLYENPQFREYTKGLSREFLQSLVLLHDFSRYFINGPFPLRYVEGISKSFGKIYPHYPQQYLHSIDWITGQEPAPATNFDISNPRNRPAAIALTLKVIDTLGKVNLDGSIREPNSFFAPHGDFERWVDMQTHKGRMPFNVMIPDERTRIKTEITADYYRERDRALVYQGIKVIKEITGCEFEEIRAHVADNIRERRYNEHYAIA